jgi:purine-cytosine permease-like protein
MADDDEVTDETSSDPTFATSGPRRSTFTPPPASAQQPVHDDDALADALAADLGRLASGAIPIVPAAPVEPPHLEPSHSEPPHLEPPSPEPWPIDVPSIPLTGPVDLPRPAAEEPPAWTLAPAPDPTQAVPLEGPYDRPVRRSLDDDDLARWVEEAGRQPGGTLDVIEQLESQLRLREEEAREFSAWENRMQSLGTPDAVAAVEDARPEFTGALPDVAAPSAFAPPEPPETRSPETRSPETIQPEATQPEATQPETTQPETTETGSFVLPEEPVAAWPVPRYEDHPPVLPYAEEAEPETPPPPPPAWDVPAPSANWAPGPEYDPESEPEPAAPVAPAAPSFEELAFAPGPDPEPAPFSEPVIEALLEPETDEAEVVDAAPFEAPPFEPPPLVEPPPLGGPPIFPSQAASWPPVTPPPLDGEDDPQARSFDFRLDAPDPRGTRSAGFTFDDTGAPAEEPPLRSDPEPESADEAMPEALFIEPLPVAAGEAIPTDTGSVTVIDQAYEEELTDDTVDETDRAFEGLIGTVSVDTAGNAIIRELISPPSGPISTVRIPEDEVVLLDNEPVRLPVFGIEESDVEPTPLDHRVGRAARLFWLWFAANSSILSLGLGAAVFAVGMSLRQSIVSVLAGVALSFLPLGLTTLAGKRSGQPTMIVSRATFGLIGNVFPAIVALVTRLFWGAVLLWLLASSIAIILVAAQLSGDLGERQLLLISLAIAFLIALLVAFAGYPLLARIQLILSIVSGVLVVGLIVMTAQFVDVPEALTTPDGSWLLTITGAVLVFSFVGLVWANSGADLARYQRVESSGASSMLWATFGSTLPSFLLIGYGALLAASDKGIASGFLLSPLDTLSLMLPNWYPIPLIAATALSLLSGITITLYSGGFALQAIGVRVRRQWSIVIVAVLLGALALLFTFGVTGGINELFRDAATSLAVPTAAWAGIFVAETMIRNRRFESQSLVLRGGVYPDVRWVNLIALFLVSAIGFGLTSATISWLSWQGYGFTLLGIPLDSDLAGTDLGVLVALVLGLLVPIVTGIPAIRRQEAARV